MKLPPRLLALAVALAPAAVLGACDSALPTEAAPPAEADAGKAAPGARRGDTVVWIRNTDGAPSCHNEGGIVRDRVVYVRWDGSAVLYERCVFSF